MRGKSPNNRGQAMLRKTRVARESIPELDPSYMPPPVWEPTWFELDTDQCMVALGKTHFPSTTNSLQIEINFAEHFKGAKAELDDYLKVLRINVNDFSPAGGIRRDMVSQIINEQRILLEQKLSRGDDAFWNTDYTNRDYGCEIETFLQALLQYEPRSEASRNLRQVIYSTVYGAMEEIDTPSNNGAETRLSSYDYADLLDVQQWLLQNNTLKGREYVVAGSQEMIELLCDPDPLLRHSGCLGLYIAYRDGEINLEDEEYNQYQQMLEYLTRNREVSDKLMRYDPKLHRNLVALRNRCFS